MLCLHQQFRRQALQTPEAVAVVDGSTSLTYRQLDQASDALAGYLQQHGIGRDQTVGLHLEKSALYIVGCLAACKAGGAFLPLFLDYPPSLLKSVMEQTQTRVVLTRSGLELPVATHRLDLDVDDSWRQASLRSLDCKPENLMFVVYTSGTTGEPKGITLPHRAAMHSYAERYKISDYQPGQRVGCNIFFVWEIFRPLLRGATVYVISDDIIYDPRQLTQFIEQHRLTEVLFTPSLLETVLNNAAPEVLARRLESLEVAILNGEVVTERLRQKALTCLPESIRLINTYSISECHDVASLDLRTLEPPPSGFCPVGYPIEGITTRILDDELYVGGPGLARGYLGKPELTAERFVEVEGERMYRTGDIAFAHPDGLLEIRGRCDSMVKIRGYSVHLGAVQSALEALPSVKACAVRAQGQEGEHKRLVAYVVRSAEADWSIDPTTGACPVLRDRLRQRLADFMIPSLFVELEQLPLSPTTGKLDPGLLPLPPRRESLDVSDISLTTDAPPAEQLAVICAVWERLLGLDPGAVKPSDHFFDLGGHSLLAVRLTVLLEEIFGQRMSVKEVVDHPTPAAILEWLSGARASEPRPTSADYQLDPAIQPATRPVLLSDAKGVLVTGATGFLAAFLVDELARHTRAPIYCLVRGDQPQQRLEANLARYGLTARATALAGDLLAPGLGLSEHPFDLVFHCAALVNYVHSYDVLKPHTVGGTLEVLKLGKTLHYISTNGIFPGGGTYLEDRHIDQYLEPLSGGYGLAKWVAEQLVWQAYDRGLPAVLYRPGNIGHHSRTGAANPNDFQYLILLGCLKLGQAPDVHHWFFEMTPVDGLVRAMVALADDPLAFGRVYNVVQSPTTPARQLFERMRAEGHIAGYLPLPEWLAQLRAAARRDGDESLEVLAESLPDVEGYLSDTSLYDGTHFGQALTRHGQSLPAAGVDYLMLALQTAGAARG
ncbi:MAG: AMP-binding protein [Candidatus Eremiobacteraeota bacterium]|nr:AMP-binding protein [Candidatus Eremiobacteraeota bacterium]